MRNRGEMVASEWLVCEIRQRSAELPSKPFWISVVGRFYEVPDLDIDVHDYLINGRRKMR